MVDGVFEGGGGDTDNANYEVSNKNTRTSHIHSDFASFSIVSIVNFQQVIHPP